MKCPPLLLNIVILCRSRSGLLITAFSDISGDRFGTVKDCSVVSLDDQERIHGMELVIVAQRTSSSDVDDPLDEVPHFLREN
ncbi:MAG: hypothetical protein ABSA46_11930 [Thermodesulfovibrionales bacterium]|jgi:hypothetical protein